MNRLVETNLMWCFVRLRNAGSSLLATSCPTHWPMGAGQGCIFLGQLVALRVKSSVLCGAHTHTPAPLPQPGAWRSQGVSVIFWCVSVSICELFLLFACVSWGGIWEEVSSETWGILWLLASPWSCLLLLRAALHSALMQGQGQELRRKVCFCVY